MLLLSASSNVASFSVISIGKRSVHKKNMYVMIRCISKADHHLLSSNGKRESGRGGEIFLENFKEQESIILSPEIFLLKGRQVCLLLLICLRNIHIHRQLRLFYVTLCG